MKNKSFTSYIKEKMCALKVAPQPGLEPGTKGLTVRSSTNCAIEELFF